MKTISIACCVWAVALAFSADASAQERELEKLAGDAGRLKVTVDTLVATKLEDRERDTRRRFLERLEQAVDLFLADDYVNVGILLYDIVEDKEFASQPRFNEALYYLGQSLYQLNQFGAARVYFQRLVEREDRRYLDDAVRQLILIADKTRNWDRIDAQVRTLAARGRVTPSIAYIYMKSLLRQGQPKRTKELLRDVPKKDLLWAKARYLAAVADVQLGAFEAARAGFDELRDIPNVYQDAKTIRDMASMNVGRLYLEEGDLTNAIDAYQDVSRGSELFERALFEVTWTFVRAGAEADDGEAREAEYEKAVRALDILLLAERERPVVPEARLLLGNIRLRMEEFQGATQSFGRVVDTYAKVQETLSGYSDDETSPEEYYDEVVRRQRSGGSLLPDLALQWAADERELNEALGVVGDLDQSDTWLSESEDLVKTLLNALKSDQRASFFPSLRDVQAKTVASKNTLFALKKRLVAIQSELVEDAISPEQARELEALREERRRIEPEYAKLPQKIEEYENQAEGMREEMRELLRQVHDLELDLTLRQRELVELTRLLSNQSEKLTDEQVADTQDNIDLEATVIDELLALSKALKGEIDRKRDLISDTADRGAAAKALRRTYQQNVEREEQILALALRQTSDVRLVRRIERQREELESYGERLRIFDERLQAVVDKRSEEILADILVQQRVLESLGDDSDKTRKVAQRVVGQVAVESLADVQNRFKDIVLRADVGIVDVAWAEKEATTQEITENVTKQRQELERFDAEFREVLIEDP